VLEGSVDFNILDAKASPYHYGIVFWGVEKTPESPPLTSLFLSLWLVNDG